MNRIVVPPLRIRPDRPAALPSRRTSGGEIDAMPVDFEEVF